MKVASPADDSDLGGPLQWPRTCRTIIDEILAAKDQPEVVQELIGKLLVHYQDVIDEFFKMKSRRREDAEDLAGSFRLHHLQKNRFVAFDWEKCPRFRCYLATALKRFFWDRGGKPPEGELDEKKPEPGKEDEDLNRAVDILLVRSIHRRVVAELEAEATNKPRFAVLRYFVPFEHNQADYTAAAEKLGDLEPTLRKAVNGLRKDYRMLFRQEVAKTVSSHDDDAKHEEPRILTELLLEAVPQEAARFPLPRARAGNENPPQP